MKTKEEKLQEIRENARKGATHRLAGRIQEAMAFESLVDRIVGAAERDGWGNEAFDAEVAGIEDAQDKSDTLYENC
jgi:mannitol-1-phosphate/altronate dehydrogenase